MSDIDFEELDRAVNSLITSQPVAEVHIPGEEKERVLNIKTQQPQPASSPSTPSVATPSVAPVQPQSTATASPILERRNGGQFMDVVHPSSNMRTAPLIMPDRSQRQQNVATTQNNRSFVTPDVNMPARPAIRPAPAIVVPPVVPQPQVPVVAPQDSPFLSDAKVEKRPLGAFSTDSPANPTPEQPAVAPVLPPTRDEEKPPIVSSVTNEGVTKSTVNAESPLPAELQNDLLLIESGSATNVDETMSDDNAATAATIAATSSINQQYAEKPSTGDQNSGAIYDTKSYHKSLTKPAKGKSGWLWVALIAGLLIVGAGAGAAIYWFVLK